MIFTAANTDVDRKNNKPPVLCIFSPKKLIFLSYLPVSKLRAGIYFFIDNA